MFGLDVLRGTVMDFMYIVPCTTLLDSTAAQSMIGRLIDGRTARGYEVIRLPHTWIGMYPW